MFRLCVFVCVCVCVCVRVCVHACTRARVHTHTHTHNARGCILGDVIQKRVAGCCEAEISAQI